MKSNFLSVDEIIDILTKNIPNSDECPPDFINGIARHIRDRLRDKYETTAKNLLITSQSASSAKAKSSFADVQKNVNQIYSNILMFEKGINILTNGINHY